jgi:LPXTG-site transpeptidase (sortase) family protein
MLIRIHAGNRDKLIRLAACACLLVAGGLAGAAAWWWVEWRAERAERAAWQNRQAAAAKAAAAAPAPAVAAVRPPLPYPRHGSSLGRFEVPALKMSWVVLEGTDDRTLERGIGHIEGTAIFGESGNIGIAGHRNTHFRKIEWIRLGDEILLGTKRETFRYRVDYIKLHQPTDVDVLAPSHGPAVTLVTCFPFEYVGSAPLRLIVRAVAVDETRTRLQAPATGPGPVSGD